MQTQPDQPTAHQSEPVSHQSEATADQSEPVSHQSGANGHQSAAASGQSAGASAPSAQPRIVRLFAAADGQSHFEDVSLSFTDRGDQSEVAELIPGSGILVRRFEAVRTNPWHHAPGRYAVFTLQGAVDITIGDGSTRRLVPGDVLIAEDLTGQGHQTREAGPEPRLSIFVPLP